MTPLSFGKVETSFGAAPEREADPSAPFKIAVLGRFSAHAETDGPLRAVRVDRDNFDEVLARLSPALNFTFKGGESEVRMRFAELDDFEPDRLHERLEVFGKLRALRARLKDPASFPQVARELTASAAEAPAPEPASSAPVSDDLFEATLAVTEAGDPGGPGTSKLADDLVREIVAPYVVPAPDPRLAEMLDSLDKATTQLMRGLLHHPEFQALEALWRGLFFLVRRLDTGEGVQLFLVDGSKRALARDLLEGDDLSASGLGRLLVEQTIGTPGGVPYAAVLADYTFEATVEDAALMGRLAKLGAAAGTAILGGGDPHLVGCESFADAPDPVDWTFELEERAATAWSELRNLPEAGHAALVAPRFLARLPYGASTSPIDSFSFEEVDSSPHHEDYLWSNGAFAAVFGLGAAYLQSGWDLRPGQVQEIEDLPVHVFEADGESRTQPCAEIQLVERSGERIAQGGIMTLWSVLGRDCIRIGPYRSLHAQPAALSGRWA
jgi:type VI secretion system protein ImpC